MIDVMKFIFVDIIGGFISVLNDTPSPVENISLGKLFFGFIFVSLVSYFLFTRLIRGNSDD